MSANRIEFVNLFEMSSDEEDYVFPENEPLPRRQKLIREHADWMNILSEPQFFSRFRLTKCTVLELLALIEPQIETRTDRNNPLSPLNRLLLTLRFFATGSFYISAGDFSGVSKSTSFWAIEHVTEAIAGLRDQFIKMPNTPQEMSTTSGKFSHMSRFPRVIGVVDGTHIRIQSLGGEGAENYRNRKGYFSRNVQVIAGPSLEILDIVTRWPGSTHDQTIFNASNIKLRFENGEFGNYFLLGDSGYECRSYIISPLHHVQTPSENLFNESLIRTRQTVERLFGVWKRRFPILSTGIRTSRRKANKADFFIVACAVLHNLACRNREQEPPVDPNVHIDLETEAPPAENQQVERNQRYQVRRDLINGWFSQML